MTQTARNDLEINRDVVTNWFAIEDIPSKEEVREEVFELLSI